MRPGFSFLAKPGGCFFGFLVCDLGVPLGGIGGVVAKQYLGNVKITLFAEAGGCGMPKLVRVPGVDTGSGACARDVTAIGSNVKEGGESAGRFGLCWRFGAFTRAVVSGLGARAGILGVLHFEVAFSGRETRIVFRA